MKLEKKKALAAKALGVGKGKIIFNKERLSEIKEAITKQDILDLFKDNAIFLRETSGRKTVVKRKTRRRHGSVKKKVKNSKSEYVSMVRKLRAYVGELKSQEKITNDQFFELRKEIRSRSFKSKAQLKERIANSR